MCKHEMVEFVHHIENTGITAKTSQLEHDEFCLFAHRMGYYFTLNDMKEVISAIKAHEKGIISDDSLASISGGTIPNYQSETFRRLAALR